MALTTQTLSFFSRAHGAIVEAWGLVAPVQCAGCATADHALCATCALELRPRLQGSPLAQGSSVPVVAATTYGGTVRRVILSLKEEGRTDLASALAPLLVRAVDGVWPLVSQWQPTAVVAVPGSRAGMRHRGFSPTALVARSGGLLLTRGLSLGHESRIARPQKSLTLDARLQVDEGRWRTHRSLAGERVVLIDDVVTTGATLRAAARCLQVGGAQVVGCAVIAATPRRQGESAMHWRFWADNDQGHGDNASPDDYREGKEA